jgi:murein DD-endopeptidase MepM/ murein hydrolase activator NlpD
MVRDNLVAAEFRGMAETKRIAHSVRRQAIRRKAQRRHSHFYDRCAHWTLFNRNASHQPLKWHRERWILGGLALLVVVLSGLVIPAWAGAMRTNPVPPVHALLPLRLPIAIDTPPPPKLSEEWRSVQVQPGQTLSDIFQTQGLTLTDLQHVMDASDNSRALHHISVGQEFQFLIDDHNKLAGIRFDQDENSRATLRLDGDKPVLTADARAVETREHIAHGDIDGSLFGAGAKAGMSNAMILKLAEVFKYDIDFVQDLRVGDSFTVIYDDVYRDGAYLREGDIVAAEFINQGKHYTAYRFRNSDGKFGYYSQEGRPLQGSFLRIPVDFTRISSQFSAGRMHPILGTMRAHKGVDYAAPTGTPIHAAGDGVVKFKGWMNGYGNFVIIQHNSTISTAYGHMSRFANIRVGQRVQQGSTIGFVGMTGLATGPHLHYEFRVNNVQRDPQTVTLPKPEPLPAVQLAKFRSEVVAPQLARINAVTNNVKMASAAHTGTNGNVN